METISHSFLRNKVSRCLCLSETAASLFDSEVGSIEERVSLAGGILDTYRAHRETSSFWKAGGLGGILSKKECERTCFEEDQATPKVGGVGGDVNALSKYFTESFVTARTFQKFPLEAKDLEALLAIFVLRSIELEMTSEDVSPSSTNESQGGSRPTKKRKVQTSINDHLREELNSLVKKTLPRRTSELWAPSKKKSGTLGRDPLFHLPCSQAEIVRLFCMFCVELYTNSSTSKNEHTLIDALDLAIPCLVRGEKEGKSIQLSLLPADLAKQFFRRINVQIISSILRHWEKRSLVQLKKQPADRKGKRAASEYDLFDNYATLLKSVSIQGLISHLCFLLQDVIVPPFPSERQKSIYDMSPFTGPPPIATQPTLGMPTGGINPGVTAGGGVPPPPPPPSSGPNVLDTVAQTTSGCLRVQSCLTTPSFIELQKHQYSHSSIESDTKLLLEQPSVGDYMMRSILIPLRSDPRFQFHRFCKHSGRDTCPLARLGKCRKLHYKRLIQPHTDVSQGDCSYLDTCRHIFSCKFVHYALDITPEERDAFMSPMFRHRVVLLNQFDVLERSAESLQLINAPEAAQAERDMELGLLNHKETWFEKGVIENLGRKPIPPQWIRCDMRSLDLGIFNGLVSVVMADPPWDIRMDLPYGTLTDHEMKELRVDRIQDEGLLFLWVTGRAMEIARDCMTAWGYRRVDELIWVKTNHLHRIIRTGRTGHWINHSKVGVCVCAMSLHVNQEHCLVGIKGTPRIFSNMECDVIVSEVRETSRKPDEIYRIIERVCPYGLKLELFGRQHNYFINVAQGIRWTVCNFILQN